MEYTLTNSNIGGIHAEDLYNYSEKTSPGLFTKFFAWCEQQESNRFFWLGITIFAQIGSILPITILTILYLGNNSVFLWIAALSVNVPSLILGLAAAKTKITLPVFFFSLFAQLLIVMYCVAISLMS